MSTLTFGLIVALIGIAIVFCGLVVLIGLIKLITIATQPRKKAEPAPTPAPAPVAQASAAAPAPAQDDALIAVITAAVAAMMEDGAAFTVRRVRRVANAPAWQRAGREEQAYSRF